MRRLACVMVLMLICALQAQATTVTLNVTDADGQTWNDGTWSVSLVTKPGYNVPSGGYVLAGTSAPVPNQTQSGSLSASGSASLTLTAQSLMAPTGSTWRFSVCPQATSPCYTEQVTITGAAQTVNLTPPAIRISMTSPPNPVTAYTDTEVVNTRSGQSYFNLTDGLIHVCSNNPSGPPTTQCTTDGSMWVTISGTAGPSEATATYVSSQTGANLGVRLTAAITALGAGGGHVYLDIAGGGTFPSDVFTAITKPVVIVVSGGTYTMPSANITVPSNITWQILQGSMLSEPATFSLILKGMISCPLTSQCLGGLGYITLAANQIQYPQWRGAKGDGVTDDSVAIQSAIDNGWPGGVSEKYAADVVFIKTQGQHWTGTYGVNYCDYSVGSTTLLPHVQSTIIEGNVGASYLSGPPTLCWNNAAMTTPFLDGSNDTYLLIRNLMLKGTNGWSSGTAVSNLITYDFPNGNHGLLLDGQYQSAENVIVVNTLGHGFVFGGNPPGPGNDNFRCYHCVAQGARGYGLFTGRGAVSAPSTFDASPNDSSQGVITDFAGYSNQMGGVGEFSRYGNIYVSSQFNSNSRLGISAGATSVISSAQRTGGVVTVVTATPVAGLVANTWVTIVGTSTGMDEACHVATVTDTQHFTCTQTGDVDAGPAAIGTVGTSASADVFAFYGSHNGNWPYGAFAFQSGVFIHPYCESNEQPAWPYQPGGLPSNTATIIGGASCNIGLNTMKPLPFAEFSSAGNSNAQIKGGSVRIRSNQSGVAVFGITFTPSVSTDVTERGTIFQLTKNDGTTNRWSFGQQTSLPNYFIIQDTENNLMRLQMGQNLPTGLNAGAGAQDIQFNKTANSGTGGVTFGSGGAAPTTVASVDGAGKGTFNNGVVSGSTGAGMVQAGTIQNGASGHTIAVPNPAANGYTAGYTVATGQATLTSGAVTNGTCATVVTVAATGTLTTDVISWSYFTAPVAATDGMLTVKAYPTADNVNFLLCNPTAASITPSGALVLNWRVGR